MGEGRLEMTDVGRSLLRRIPKGCVHQRRVPFSLEAQPETAHQHQKEDVGQHLAGAEQVKEEARKFRSRASEKCLLS